MRKALLLVGLFWIAVIVLSCCTKKIEVINTQSIPKLNLEVVKTDNSKIILPVN